MDKEYFHDLNTCKVSCVECKMCDLIFQKFEHHFIDKLTELSVIDYQSKVLKKLGKLDIPLSTLVTWNSLSF